MLTKFSLIAVMLGRLRMSVADCMQVYINLSEKAFTKKNLFDRAKGKVTLGPKFKTRALEDAIKQIIGEDWATKLLKEDDSKCKVFALQPNRWPSFS